MDSGFVFINSDDELFYEVFGKIMRDNILQDNYDEIVEVAYKVWCEALKYKRQEKRNA